MISKPRPGYVCCWRVQDEYGLAPEQRNELIGWLADNRGAIAELFIWERLKPQQKLFESFISVTDRSLELYDFLLKKAVGSIRSKFTALSIRSGDDIVLDQYANVNKYCEHIPKKLLELSKMLKTVILHTYGMERPEKFNILNEFSERVENYASFDEEDYYNFFYEQFMQLYYDSLVLRLRDVRGYFRENEIEQVHGFVNKLPKSTEGELKDAPACDAKAKLVSTGSRKDTARIKATRKACEHIKAILEQEAVLFSNDIDHWEPSLLFTVAKNAKTNWRKYIAAVQETLAPMKYHFSAARDEWKKVPDNLKHGGRVPDQ